MRTTVDIPDDLFREIKAQAAMKGQSLKSYILAALNDYQSRLVDYSGTKSSSDLQSQWQKQFDRVSKKLSQKAAKSNSDQALTILHNNRNRLGSGK